ncbi:MAG TPA: hypothetical protein P5528_05230 [Steroidobacteraceae bacterium]|nr:hypothetical protein [Steroidobacteraceae bacterium]HRX88830.1 hypothetical protein [Steroidobacteraceae bacterium]
MLLRGIHFRARVAAAATVLTLGALHVTHAHTAGGSALLRTNAAFCLAAQYLMADTTETPTVELHGDFESFKKSKTSIAPFGIHQFVQYADDRQSLPTRISCKLKTVDHLQNEYGAQAAGPTQLSCRDLNAIMVRNVFAAMSKEEQARVAIPLARIWLEPDLNSVLGSKWVADYQHVWQAADGGLHLFAKTLHVPYEHWLWRFAPERFRGVYYCHLVAPEYLRALVLGESTAPSLAEGET